MPIFTKKPLAVEARQFLDIESAEDLLSWIGDDASLESDTVHGEIILIDALEGLYFAQAGDWIVKDVQGEFLPYTPEAFERAYQAR